MEKVTSQRDSMLAEIDATVKALKLEKENSARLEEKLEICEGDLKAALHSSKTEHNDAANVSATVDHKPSLPMTLHAVE